QRGVVWIPAHQNQANVRNHRSDDAHVVDAMRRSIDKDRWRSGSPHQLLHIVVPKYRKQLGWKVLQITVRRKGGRLKCEAQGFVHDRNLTAWLDLILRTQQLLQ